MEKQYGRPGNGKKEQAKTGRPDKLAGRSARMKNEDQKSGISKTGYLRTERPENERPRAGGSKDENLRMERPRNERLRTGSSRDENPRTERPKSGNLEDRRKAARLCPVFEKCGGCQLLHLPYQKQLEEKKKMLEALLEGICPVKTVIGMKDPFHYRNKVHAVFGHDKRGNPLSGVYQEGTHFLVPIEKCMIEDEKADEIIGTIRGMLRSFKIKTYDEDTGYGFLRHVLVKRAFATGEIMVVLVTSSPIFPSKNNFIKALREKHPEITTIIQNLNHRDTSMVLGDKEQILFGKGYIEDVLCGYRFRISPKSFYQINPVQAKVLYEKALELAKLTGKETVLDAYCGVGTIGIIASQKAAKVIGVELNKDAVKDAVQNAKQNDINNIQFYCNDASRFIADMAAKGEKVDVVLMDPPRSGSTSEFIDAVAMMGPERVIYVSCGPESLARDLRVFKSKGYRVVECVGVDMFAETRHVECVVKLCRVEK